MKELFVLFLSRAKTLERVFFDVSMKVCRYVCDSELEMRQINTDLYVAICKSLRSLSIATVDVETNLNNP